MHHNLTRSCALLNYPKFGQLRIRGAANTESMAESISTAILPPNRTRQTLRQVHRWHAPR